MNNRAQIVKRAVSIVVALGLILASGSIVAGASWTQTDWSGGSTAPTLSVVTETVTSYFNGENENVSTTGQITLYDNQPVEDIVANVRISEVYPGRFDDSGSEFVELYNPTGSAIDISGWHIATPTSESDATIPASTTIAAYSYYLVADEGWSASKDNLSWPDANSEQIITYAQASGRVGLSNSSYTVIDNFSWGATVAAGDSVERKAQSSSTSSTLWEPGEGSDASSGNGYDTDATADIIEHDNNQAGFGSAAFPENSLSPIEKPPMGYGPAGWLVSSVFDAGGSATWSTASWTATTAGDSSIIVRVRTSNSSDMSGATAWASVTAADNGSDISSLTGVTDSHRYIQYRVELTASSDNTQTPTFSDITINYTTNQTPTAPTTLWTENLDNPENIVSVNPGFSAIYNDLDSGDTATHAYIQVGTDNWTSAGTWDSGWIDIADFTQGNRCENIAYGGSTRLEEGTTYYWRIKFKDTAGAEGTYSDAASFKMQSVSISVTDGTNTLDNTTLNGGRYLGDRDITITITLTTSLTGDEAPTLYYDTDNDPTGRSSDTASGSGASWTVTIAASNSAIDNGSDAVQTVQFNVELDNMTSYYRTTDNENWAFGVDGDPPYNVGCITPENGDNNVAVTTSLVAQDALDSGSGLHSTPYYFQLDTAADFGAPDQYSGWQSSTSWTPTSLTANITYYWRVKARDSMENENSWMGHGTDTPGYGVFKTAAGQAVSISSVATDVDKIYVFDGSKYLRDANATVEIRLSLTTSAVKLYYDDVSTLSDATSVSATGTGTSWNATISASNANVCDGATVHFVVEVLPDNYYRTGTTPWSYKVDEAGPYSVGLHSPSDGAIGQSITPTLAAENADDNGVGLHSTPYYFQLATDNNFTQNVQTTGWQSGATWSPNLALETTYYWRVMAKDALGNESSYTSYRSFTTLGMYLSLATDKDNYKLGEAIQVSGTATSPAGGAIASGDVTLRFTIDNYSENFENVKISNGDYSYTFQTTRAKPQGEWTLTATAVDSYGNTAENSKHFSATIPEEENFYEVEIISPSTAATTPITRGDQVQIRVKVKYKGTDNLVSGAQVSVTMPQPYGEEENLVEDNDKPGEYFLYYTVGWSDSTGGWTISAGAEKTAENVTQAGANLINVEINPAKLQVVLVSPEGKVEEGQIIQVRVRALYPDGSPAEDTTVTVLTPAGESLVLIPEGSGYYSKTYTITTQDVGTWKVQASAADLYGNSGASQVTAVTVTQMSPTRVVITYWWVFLAVFAAVGAASAYLAWRTMLVRRLKRVQKELREIPKLKKEAMIKYFKEGSIERDTYDEMMDEHDMRMGELRKQEELLSAKLGKREKKKKAKRSKGKKKR